MPGAHGARSGMAISRELGSISGRPTASSRSRTTTVGSRAGSWPSSRWANRDTFRTALTFWREHQAGASCRGARGNCPRGEAPVGDQRFVQSLKDASRQPRLLRYPPVWRLASRSRTSSSMFLRDLLGDLVGNHPPGLSRSRAGRPVVFAGAAADEALAARNGWALPTPAADVAGLSSLAYEPLGAAYWYARELRSR